MTNDIEDRLDEFKDKLEKRLEELLELDAVSKDSQKTVTLDQSRVGRLSRMDAMQAQQMAAETARRRKIEMQRIKAAFIRIKEEEYGYCIKCGEPIQRGRLDHDPSTPTCINCARG